ncbi:MAG TPA: electron transfer flavoprotein subunit alpha/FixB family protein, partial [Bacteroidia bacterium]|nr:electron transfer flavoprotein subunit alpha/FixB family protein [Bacteroidia bacterium]
MAILVFTESGKERIRKNSLEAVNYAAQIAGQLNTTVTAVIDGHTDPAKLSELGKAGAKEVLTIRDEKLTAGSNRAWAIALEQVANSVNAQVIIFPHDLMGKAIAPRLAARLKAGIVAGAVDHPKIEGGKFTVRKNSFSGKATSVYVMHSDKKVITLLPNSFPLKLSDNTATITAFTADLSQADDRVKVKEVKPRSTTTVALPEAELVVSAG